MVDPSAWANISSQLGHTVAVGSTTSAGLWGWAAAGIVAVAIGTTIYFAQGNSARVPEDQISEVSVRPSTPQDRPADDEKGQMAESFPVVPSRTNAITTTDVNASGPTERSSGSTSAPVATIAELPQTSSTVVPEEVAVNPDPQGQAVVDQIITEITEQAKQAADKGEPAFLNNHSTDPPDAISEIIAEEDAPSEQMALPKLFLQNVFTPNGDGVNDEYEVRTEGFEKLLFRVYSVQTNQLVFSTNTGEKWTGNQCETGSYLVAVEAITTDGRLVTEGKVIWLNRNPMN